MLHYTLEGSTTVVATLKANIATLDFIKHGLPGSPENFEVVKLESRDGTELTDWKVAPPEIVYVVGRNKEKGS
jgi:hypothetical protein